MEITKILDEDVVSRTLSNPKDFIMVAGMPQLDLKNNLQFQINKKTGLREESVNCMRLFEGDIKAACHAQGRKKCDLTNAGRIVQNPKAILEEYWGYTSAKVERIRNINEMGVSFTVNHTPQNDNYAHCDIVMLNADSDGIGKQIRKAAKDKLIKCFDILVTES